MVGELVMNIVRRSIPIPSPDVGGIPYSSARTKSLSDNQSASVQVLDYTTLRHYRMSMFSKLLKNSVNEFAFISDDSGVDGAVPDVTDWITGSMMFSMRV